jgi:hypothetical protein
LRTYWIARRVLSATTRDRGGDSLYFRATARRAEQAIAK